MKKRLPISRISAQCGIVLIEVLIAILIFSLGILGLVGMQANMVRATTDAQYRSEATFIVQQKIAEMWLNQDKLSTFAGDTDISDELPGGWIKIERGCDGGDLACFTVTVEWQLPGSQEDHQVVTVTRITRS